MKREFAFLIVLILFLSGCDGLGGGGSPLDFNPYHGSQGLEMKFIDNAPPDEIVAGKTFKIGIEVNNEGTFDIDDCVLTLNYVKDDLNIGGSTKSINLYGRSAVISDGENKAVFWDASPKDNGFSTEVWVEAKYKYQTNMFEDLCVDPEPYGQNLEKGQCSAQDRLSLGNQGAPIAVTLVEITAIPKSASNGELIFTITAKNVGGGDVYGGSSASNEGELNTMSVRAFLSNSKMSCNPSVMRKEDDVWKTECTGHYAGAIDAYLTPLHIQLDYIYRTTLPSRGSQGKSIYLKKP